MALVGGFAKAMPMNRGQALPALCQHGGSALETRKTEQTSLYREAGKCHIRSGPRACRDSSDAVAEGKRP
jgi:hypothetical protein